MSIRRILTTAAAAGLLTATATGATGVAGPASATPTGRTCAPSWSLVPTPPSPGNYTQMTGVAAIPGSGAWFPGWTRAGLGGQEPWVLHSDGDSLGMAPQIPKNPVVGQDTSVASFDSATDGWVLGASASPGSQPMQYAAHWNGHRWVITPLAVSPDPVSFNLQLNGVASLSPGSAWAVGAYYPAGTIVGNAPAGALIEHWDGKQWGVVPNPASAQPGTELTGISAASASGIWAVGRQRSSDGADVPLIEHWDGTAWSTVPAPAGAAPSALTAVSADGPSDAWAVGDQLEQGTSNLATGLAEHWDGTSWTAVTSLPDLGNSRLSSVYAAGPTSVWATVETPGAARGITVSGFLHWDGTSWTTMQPPGPQEYGVNYGYTLGGAGLNDIWAAGEAYNLATGTATPQITRLSCG